MLNEVWGLGLKILRWTIYELCVCRYGQGASSVDGKES